MVTTDEEFYVGVTERPPEQRWKEHMGKGYYSGAEFLQGKEIDAFILVADSVKNAEEIENKLTLQLMAKYGIDNCSGGEYAVDGNPRLDARGYFSNPEEYDFLSDVEVIESEPIAFDDAHPSVKLTKAEILFKIIFSSILVFIIIFLFIFLFI